MASAMGVEQYNALHLELGVRNVAAIIANFHKADALAQEEFREVVEETAQQLASLTSFYAPYDTGFMSEHVVIRYTPSGLGFEVGWDAADFFAVGEPFYPFFQEFGTINQPAQPSLGPAWLEEEPTFRWNLTAAANRAIARASGR